MRYSFEIRDQIYVKEYGFLSFEKNMGQSLRESLNSKHGQNILYTTKMLATDVLKTVSQNEIQKAAEATGDLVGNKTFR